MSPRSIPPTKQARAGRKGGQIRQSLIPRDERKYMGTKGMLSRWYGIKPDDVPPGLDLVVMRICIPYPALVQLQKWIDGALAVEKNWEKPENSVIKTSLEITKKQLGRTWERYHATCPETEPAP